MWTTFKVFTELVTIMLLFYVLTFGHKTCGFLVPQSGIKPMPPALESSLNHLNACKIPVRFFK